MQHGQELVQSIAISAHITNESYNLHIYNSELMRKLVRRGAGLPEVEFFSRAGAEVLSVIEADEMLWAVGACQGRQEAGGLTLVTLPLIIRQ